MLWTETRTKSTTSKKIASTGIALIGMVLFHQTALAQSRETLDSASGLLRSQSTYSWSIKDSDTLPVRLNVRTRIADMLFGLGAEQHIVNQAFDLKTQASLPGNLRFYREGRSFGHTYNVSTSYDILELQHSQLTWFSRLLYASNPAAVKAVLEKLGPVFLELANKPHYFTVAVSDDQYAGGDRGDRDTRVSPEVLGNLIRLIDRLDANSRLSPMAAELRAKAMAVLSHPVAINFFASQLSGGLLDGYSETGIYLRRYFDLIEAANPKIWKTMAAQAEANPDNLPTTLLTLKFWATRDVKYFRRLLIETQWFQSGIFKHGIPSYDPYQILRANPELLELTVLRALEAQSPTNYYAGHMMSAAEAAASKEASSPEHRLIEGIRKRLPQADHAHRAIGNLFLAAGPEGAIYLGPYPGVSKNENLLEIAMQEAKKQGIEKVDVKRLAAVMTDFRNAKSETDFLSELRHWFGAEKINGLARTALTADEELSRRHQWMSHQRRTEIRTGALLELLARNLLTLHDVDLIVRDMNTGTRWLHELSKAHDYTVLGKLKTTIRDILKANGYEGGAGYARYLRERHGLAVEMSPGSVAELQALQKGRVNGEPRLMETSFGYQANLVSKTGASVRLTEALALVGYLTVLDRNKTSGTLRIGIDNNPYSQVLMQSQIRQTNAFLLESYANWLRETGSPVPVEPSKPQGLRSRLGDIRGKFLGCEGAFISVK